MNQNQNSLKLWFERFSANQAELYQKILEFHKYIPYIYEQINTNTQSTGLFIIDYINSEIPHNCILYMLPKCNSNSEYEIGTGTNSSKQSITKLKVVFSRDQKDNTIKSYKEYNILCENADGSLSNCANGSITAGRVAQFRFPKGTDYCILLNNPIYNSAKIDNLEINHAIFREIPLVIPTATEDSSAKGDAREMYELGLYSYIKDLENRVAKLENKFVVGKENIDKVIDDLPDGTFYIQVEEDEV